MDLTRRSALAGLSATVMAPGVVRAQSKAPIKVGVIGTTSDAPFFIADRKGWFREEGISVDFIFFDSAAKMMAPLGTGDLSVGGGATSAALYNAAARQVQVKIVADKAKNTKGHGFQALMVRKALEAEVKSFADLKGRKVAVSAPGNSEQYLLSLALAAGGLKLTDIDLAFLGFPQHPAAFANGAIDASISTEPTTTSEIKNGVAFKLAGADTFAPNFQTAVTFYSGEFIGKDRETGQRFMKALLRAARFYHANLVNGHLVGPQAEEIIAIMVQDSPIKDPQVYRDITSHDIDPNGEVDEASLRAIWGFFKDQNLIDGSRTLDDVLDMSFARAAAKELGPMT